MAHTNISLPARHETWHERDSLRIELLECELAWYKTQYNSMRMEFTTIPESIKEYGYVDLYCKEDGIDMKLVKDKKQNGDNVDP